MMKKLQMSKEAFDMAKGAFRKVFKKHKSEASRTKKTKGLIPTVPYDLKKADVKKRLRSINLTTAAEIKATPGARRKILLRIEKDKRAKTKFRTPVVYGKAYASDKKGKTMQIQPLTRNQRKLMLKEMAVSADRGYKQVRKRKYGYNSGGDVKSIKTVASKLKKGKYVESDGPMNIYGRPIGKKPRQDLRRSKYAFASPKYSPAPKKKNKGGDIKIVKTVASKLQKASKAHAGQSKQLKRVISKYV